MKSIRNIKNQATMMLLGIVAAIALTSCADDSFEEQAKAMSAEEMLVESTDLANMEQYSYAIPVEVAAQGKWKISFQFNEGHQICYAFPNEGNGPATVKVCVLDNWTDSRRTGSMTVTDLQNPSASRSYKLSQKCNRDYETRASNLVTPDKGNIIYGVGYGFNIYKPISNAITTNPIVRVEEFKANNVIQTKGVDATFKYTQYTGSTLSELTSDFKAKANFAGKGKGLEGEVSAAFGTKDFSSDENEYMLSEVSVVRTNAVITNTNEGMLMRYYMCDEAYANINGFPYVAPGSDPDRQAVVAFPSTDEGFYKLVKCYGTHLIRSAQLGGRLRYATTVNISKVEGNYNLEAFAKCNYQCPWGNDAGELSEDVKSAYSSNTSAQKTNITVYGGDQNAARVIMRMKYNQYYWEWLKSLEDIRNQKVISIDTESLMPLWELVNEAEAGGRVRKAKLKDYIENRLELDMAREEGQEIYETGSIYRITNIPDFKEEAEVGTLIKDVFASGQRVARICNEFIPQINKQQRVNVIYPVVSGKVKYNLGYYPGDKYHRPYYVCSTDNDLTVREINTEAPGEKTSLYLRGSKLTSELSTENSQLKTVNTKIENAYLNAPCSNSEKVFTGKYQIVKIFNRIWQRTHYFQPVYTDNNQNYRNHFYYADDLKNFNLSNWHVGTVSDYQNLLDGLTKKAGYNLPASKMFSDSQYKAEDLTGFHVQWLGWKDNGSHRNGNNNDQMEYLTVDQNNVFGHVRILKTGSMEICQNEFNKKNWRMAVRMVQRLSE